MIMTNESCFGHSTTVPEEGALEGPQGKHLKRFLMEKTCRVMLSTGADALEGLREVKVNIRLKDLKPFQV